MVSKGDALKTVIVTLFVFFFALPVGLAAEFPFATDTLKDTVQRAKKSKNPIVVKVYTDWCGPCKRMDKEVFASTDMLERAPRIEALKVDGDSTYGKSFLKKHGVQRYPTILFLSSTGEEVHRLVGARSRRGFVKLIDALLNGTLTPEGPGAPPKPVSIAYRSAFLAALNTPNTASEELKALHKSLSPKDEEMHGMALYLRGTWVEHEKPKDARRTLKKITTKHKGTKAATYALLPLAQTLTAKQPLKGFKLLHKALKKAPNHLKEQAALRLVQFGKDAPASVMRKIIPIALQELQDGSPLEGALLDNLSILYVKLGQKDDAIEALKKARDRFPAHPWYGSQLQKLQ